MTKKRLLIAILVGAALLRLIGLSWGDSTNNDEVLYSFRAVGMLDFDEAQFQTTPLEWFDPNSSWWTQLSFHDHPPLVFFVQHIFMKIFGENNFAYRLPSALLGMASVYLIYLLGKILWSENTGLLSAALFGATVNNVYISRLGIQESYVVFFILLASYLFLKALQNDKYFIWTGLALGLGFLTKYNVFILAPIFLAYLLIFRREIFRNKKFWLGALLSIALFSPVIIYNIQLYRAVGHFDFQFSYIFGQHPKEWPVAPGKEEIGGLADRVRNFLPHLFQSNSWIFLGLFFMSLPAVIKTKNWFLLSEFVGLVLLLLFIGPTFRFLSMLTPFLALSIGSSWQILRGKFSYILFAAVLLFEILYSLNSQILYYPIGPEFWAFSKVRYDNYNWGYNELGGYLTQELQGKRPALSFDMRYDFLNKLRDRATAREKNAGLKPYPALIVYDGNIQNLAQAWHLDRLQIYHGWPIIKADDYLKILKENGADYFNRAGIRNYYFLTPTDKVPLKKKERLTLTGAIFEKELIDRGIAPISIYNKRREEIIRVYKFGVDNSLRLR